MPEVAARGDLTNNQSPNSSVTATPLLIHPTIPFGYKAAVHAFSLLVPPLAWTLLNLFVGLRNQPPDPQLTNPISLFIVFDVIFGIVTFINFIYYALAGGLEWQPAALSVTRVALYMVVSGIVLGLLLVAYWLFVRSVAGSIFKLGGVNAMGRLFRVREI